MAFKLPSKADLSASFTRALKRDGDKEKALQQGGWSKSEDGKNWKKEEFELPTDAAHKMELDMKKSKKVAEPI